MVLIDKADGNIITEDHTRIILNKKPDKDEILRQISYDEKIPTSSYWNGIILLPPGCTYIYDLNLQSSNIKINLLDQTNTYPSAIDDPLEILISFVSQEYKNNNCEKLVVRLSGGVDSTCLLLAAIEVAGPDRVTAITWIDEQCSANKDRKSAIALCKTLKINHLLFKFEPDYFFQDILPENHFLIDPGMASDHAFKKERDFISNHLFDRYIVLDGHGGDHLFLDPVPSTAYHDLLKNMKFIEGFKIAAMVSKLTGSSIYETITRDRQQRNYETDRRSHFLNTQFLQTQNFKAPKNLAEERLQTIAQAMYQNAMNSTTSKDFKIVYPFTSQQMVEYGLKQNPYNMFSDCDTRLPLRNSIKEKHPNIILRRDKGHITSAYQKALKHHEKNILSKLRQSWLAQENLINMPHVEQAITRSTLGLGGIEKILLKIICTSLIKDI